VLKNAFVLLSDPCSGAEGPIFWGFGPGLVPPTAPAATFSTGSNVSDTPVEELALIGGGLPLVPVAQIPTRYCSSPIQTFTKNS
jgi:hypothetical protein